MLLTPSERHALRLYCEVQGDAKVHPKDEQHSWVSNTPRSRIVANVALRLEDGSKGVATPSPRAITLPQVRIMDAPHGESEISPSPPIMHTVACASLLHPARALWAASQGSKPGGTAVRVRRQSTPVRAQQASQEPYPFVASACCTRNSIKGSHEVWPFARATNSVMNSALKA